MSYAALVDPLVAAVREAAELVHRAYRSRPLAERKGAVDLVTQWDRDAEELLRERLAPHRIPIVGEESGGDSEPLAPTFFIDPIDGTTNFVHGHPFFCVSAGLAVADLPVLGVVVAPALHAEWVGLVESHGPSRAERDRAACAPSAVATIDAALLATGFPYDRRTSAENNFDAFVAIKMRCQAVRRCGSAALDLCLVADGTYDGYWERKLHPWDLCGGAAIVRASGGSVTDFDGGDAYLGSGSLVATNGALHATLLAELARVPQRPAAR